MKLKRMRNFVLWVSFCWAPFSWAQTDSVTSSLAPASRNPAYFDFYSESSYYEAYDLVTDSRLRYYQPLRALDDFKTSLYLGVGLQYQSPGSREKYFDNTANPNVGLQLDFGNLLKLQAQAGYRTVLGTNNQHTSTEWDPRIILSGGHLWQWPVPENFTEGYAESVYVPRLSSTPVSVAWAKQGYRWKPQAQLSIDAYGEFYLRESRSEDLGPSVVEWRVGGRAQYRVQSWSLAALLYHPLQKHASSGEVEGLFVVGGYF